MRRAPHRWLPISALAAAMPFFACSAVQSLGYDLPADASRPPESDDDDEPTTERLRVESLAPGLGYHACALLTGGKVKCWGLNDYGQLGLGDKENRGDNPGEMGEHLAMVDLGAGITAKAIVAGVRHTCVIVEDGRVKCWGKNDYGQLGLGDTQARGDAPNEMGDALPFVDLGSGRTALSIVAGQEHTCALLDDRSVKCWGGNRGGALGLGDTKNRGDAPGQMGDALPTVDLAAISVTVLGSGAYHTCAILGSGKVKCWGDNQSGELGLGEPLRRGDDPGEMGAALPAIQFPPQTVPSTLSGGSDTTCARFATKDVRCWGMNTSGQSGIGTKSYDPGTGPGEMASLPSVDLGPGREVSEVSAGGGHNCALLVDGDVKCWGFNEAGQLGLGDTRERGGLPSDMGANLGIVDLGSHHVRSIASGAEHTCALLDDRSVKCWGANTCGQLGQGDKMNRGGRTKDLGDALAAVPILGE